MKHFMLKFNHGVEIGAHLAYIGHFKRTGEKRIAMIIEEEADHGETLESILEYYGQRPSPLISAFFTIVGTMIQFMCRFSPLFMLDFVARSMELFAVFNYGYLSAAYPEFEFTFHRMARTELEHQQFFKRKKK